MTYCEFKFRLKNRKESKSRISTYTLPAIGTNLVN